MTALPNLASRPFVNRRPIQRAAVLLWLVGGALVALNGTLYWQHITGAGRRQHELAQIAAATTEERLALTEHAAVLAKFDLDWQNDQVRLLNTKIAERSFSWSTLFDQLAEVLPREVRLERLQPTVERGDAGGRRQPDVHGERVSLAMNGAAASGEALYAFLDALFAHPAFDRPLLSRETRDEEVEFVLTVTYLPGAAQAAASEAREEGTAPEGAPPVAAPAGEDAAPDSETPEAKDVPPPVAEDPTPLATEGLPLPAAEAAEEES